MRYLGIDYGTKRVGIATSDESGTFAFPKLILARENAVEAIRELVEKERIGAVILGDTRSLAGASNTITPEAEAFKAELSRTLSIPVETMWEAWSSHEAARYAPTAEKDDSAAAAIILQRYLDMRKS